MSPVPDLRFAFKAGAVALIEAVREGHDPEKFQEFIEDKFQDFYKLYSQLTTAMAGLGFDDDLVAALLPKA